MIKSQPFALFMVWSHRRGREARVLLTYQSCFQESERRVAVFHPTIRTIKLAELVLSSSVPVVTPALWLLAVDKADAVATCRTQNGVIMLSQYQAFVTLYDFYRSYVVEAGTKQDHRSRGRGQSVLTMDYDSVKYRLNIQWHIMC